MANHSYIELPCVSGPILLIPEVVQGGRIENCRAEGEDPEKRVWGLALSYVLGRFIPTSFRTVLGETIHLVRFCHCGHVAIREF